MLNNIYDLVNECNISPLSAATATIAIVLSIVYYVTKLRGLPPGPTGLPALGYYPFLRQDCHVHLQELGKKYGELYSISITGHLYIHLGTVKAIREVQIANAEALGGRITDFSLLAHILGGSVGFVNGEAWKVLRKFFLQQFKDYGLISMKDDTSVVLYDSVNSTITELRDKKSEPVNLMEILMEKCSCIMNGMILGNNGISKKELLEINELYEIAADSITGTKALLIGELARRIIFPVSPGYAKSIAAYNYLVEMMYKIINDHKSTYNEHHVRNIVDCYLKERNERQRSGDPTAEYFTDKSLMGTLIEYFGDAVLTNGFFLYAIFKALIDNPEEQEIIYKELIEVVGRDRQPIISDKSNLPYANAFLLEVLRTAFIVPFIPCVQFHKNTTIRGYRIPKGAITLLNVWAAQYDPDTYEEPEKFNPRRYLRTPGKPRAEPPVLFGVGKRNCIGEAFAVAHGFLFLTAIVQNFRLTMPESESIKSDSSEDASLSLRVCATPRN